MEVSTMIYICSYCILLGGAEMEPLQTSAACLGMLDLKTKLYWHNLHISKTLCLIPQFQGIDKCLRLKEYIKTCILNAQD